VRVATDIGGTFTDLIYLDEATGEVGMTKASTTPHNFAIGVEDTLVKSGINVPDTTFFVHGSTIIINALTERKGVKTGLITTQGSPAPTAPTSTTCTIPSRSLSCPATCGWR
jgi:N-methylhydantoinase A